MSSDPKGTDNLQAEIAREYKEFKSSGEVMRLDDEPDELTTLRAKVAELEAKVPKWVSVEDGLPEENENVWISAISPQSGERFFTDGTFYGGLFHIFDTMTDASDSPVDPDYWQHITPPEDKSDG